MPRGPASRREFITPQGGAATAWPLGAYAQPPTMPVIGYLDGSSPEQSAVPSFREGLTGQRATAAEVIE